MEYFKLKKILFFLSVFLLVFLGGLGILLFHREPLQKTGNRKPAITVPQSPRTTLAPRNLPPLRLPPGATAVRCPENSWEYSGEFAANFVSARAQLSSWLQNQLWQPERLITLEENLKPRIILTFSAKDYELTLLLWKIKTDLTGFSYRRDKKSEPSGGIVQ